METSVAPGTVVLHEFRTRLLSATGTLPRVAKGSRRELERYVPLEEFGSLFGGYVLWNPLEVPTEGMPGVGLGVWGSRNVARLRRVLRDRGAEVVRVQGPGPEQTVKAIAQTCVPSADR